MSTERPLAIYYEHPTWFQPLFDELERRHVPHLRIDAGEHAFNPTHRPRYAAVFNQVGATASRRERAGTIFYTHSYLTHLEEQGVPLINGIRAWRYETSRALQVELLLRLGIRTPKTRVVNHPSQLPAAAEGLLFPVIVSSNLGGVDGKRFDSFLSLVAGVYDGLIESSVDGTLVVQEYHWPEEGSVVRSSVLGGSFTHAARVTVEKNKSIAPSSELIALVERIAQAARIDVGSVESFVSLRDGETYVSRIGTLAVPAFSGTDGVSLLADFLQEKAARIAA